MTTRLLVLRNNRSKYRLTRVEWTLCVGFMLLATVWALVQPYNYAPDEYSRYLIPQYIYQFHELPNGRDEAVRFSPQGTSFAFRLTIFPSIVSALCMQIISLFSVNDAALLFGARFASVFFGTASVYLSIKISKGLFSKRSRWVFIALMALIPQFVFLSSYINNDIACVFGSLLVSYSWVRALDEGWSVGNCLLLSLGLAVCILSYYNGYAWIIASVVFCVGLAAAKRMPAGLIVKRVALVIAVILLLVLPFLIRNAVLYDGDVFGFSVSTLSASLYEDKSIITPDSAGEFGYTMMDVILGNVPEQFSLYSWLVISAKSFIGVFGYMSDFLPTVFYYVYCMIFLIGILGFVVAFVVKCRTRSHIRRELVLFYLCCIAVIAITFAIDLYFTVYTSYQAQGRYMYPALLPIVAIVSKGYDGVLLNVANEKIALRISCAFLGLMLLLALVITTFYFLPFVSA